MLSHLDRVGADACDHRRGASRTKRALRRGDQRRGPRYCPSIEDKMVKFPDAERHQVFLEPEGLDTSEMYVNGLSTSLPAEVQFAFLRTVPGLEHVRMTRLGYAIEYDYCPPAAASSLARVAQHSRALSGRVRSTARPGTRRRRPGRPGRDQCRRACEGAGAGGSLPRRRLYRRPGGRSGEPRSGRAVPTVHVAVRVPSAPASGQCATPAVSSGSTSRTARERREASRGTAAGGGGADPPNGGRYGPDSGAGQPDSRGGRRDAGWLESASVGVGATPRHRPDRSAPCGWFGRCIATEWADIELKYSGYLHRERRSAQRMAEMDGLPIPGDLRYEGLQALSYEARQKLSRVRPETLGQAGRIPGVSPSDLQNLVLAVVKSRK